MKKAFSFLFSMLFTGILVMIFAIAIAYATFIENDFGTVTAKILVYNSKWFEGLLVLLCINLIGSVIVNKMIQKKQWPIFLFHIAFVVIGIGAAITRYYGYEGTMHIRERASTNTIVSESLVINIKAESGGQSVSSENSVMFSPYTANHFSHKININGKTLHIENLMYMPSAEEMLTVDPMGEPIVSFMAIGTQNQRIDFNLRSGDSKQIDNISIGFETPTPNTVKLRDSGNSIMISALDSITISDMSGNVYEVIPPNSEVILDAQKVYSIGTVTFAMKQYLQKGRTQLVYNQTERGAMTTDGLQMRVSDDVTSKELIVYGSSGDCR